MQSIYNNLVGVNEVDEEMLTIIKEIICKNENFYYL